MNMINRNNTLIVYSSRDPSDAPYASTYLISKYLSKVCRVLYIYNTDDNASYEFPLNAKHNIVSFMRRYFRSDFFKWCFPSLVPFNRFTIIRKINYFFNRFVLAVLLLFEKHIHNKRIVYIKSYPEASKADCYIPYDILIFDCYDKYYAVQFIESKDFIAKANIVFANSQLLNTELSQWSKNVVRVSPGYHSWTKIIRKNVKKKKTKTVVYLGGISGRIDFPLLTHVITRLKEVDFFFIGSLYPVPVNSRFDWPSEYSNQWELLASLPNVYWLGSIPKNKILRTVSQFNIGIIPYDVRLYFNQYSHPMKLYEYLFVGLPVVSTNLPVVREVSDDFPIDIATNTNQFKEKILKAIHSEVFVLSLRQRSRILRETSVQFKAKQMIEALEAR